MDRNQERCLFCAESLLVKNHNDSVKDHCHVTGKYRGAAHNECNLKVKLNAKTVLIPVAFHNVKGYDSHLLIQVMARMQGEIKYITTNTEKYISFSLGGLRLIDSMNFLLSSLDSIVKGSEPMSFKIKENPFKDSTLLLKKGIYPYEYMDLLERFSEAGHPATRRSQKKSTSTRKRYGKRSAAGLSATITIFPWCQTCSCW